MSVKRGRYLIINESCNVFITGRGEKVILSEMSNS